MRKKENKVCSHLYDLGSYQFNGDDDVSLLIYDMSSLEHLEELHKLRKTTNSTSYTLRHSSVVPQIETTTPTLIRFVRPITSCYESTRNLMKGLATTIDKVNEKIRLLSDDIDFSIEPSGFDVTEYAKILTANENHCLFFPVEVIKNVKAGNETFEICINLDNPTSLDERNQQNGCQGSHFGYSIISKSNGFRTRGHILMTTFVGYPSRNEREKSKVMKEFKERKENSRVLNVEKLCIAAMNPLEHLPFCITTAKGINAERQSSIYHSERIKKLPQMLKALHVTFVRDYTNLPDFMDKKSKKYFNL